MIFSAKDLMVDISLLELGSKCQDLLYFLSDLEKIHFFSFPTFYLGLWFFAIFLMVVLESKLINQPNLKRCAFLDAP